MRDQIEKLGSLFLAVFSTGLTAQLARGGGLAHLHWVGALAAVAGSLSLAAGVRIWPATSTVPRD